MKINSNTAIKGQKVILVPYRKEHVERYHEWMKSPELLALTASEPLSLEEEYQMQASWAADEDKCTFIILDPSRPGNQEESRSFNAAMAGDVNLFFNDHDDPKAAEIEIMIAEPESRQKGLGREALLLMMHYGIERLKVTKYVAKISLENRASITLFQSLQFNEVSISEYFKEVSLELEVSQALLDWLAPLVVSREVAVFEE